MLTVNVMIIGQPPVTAIIRWHARLAYESTVTVMDSRQWILYRELPSIVPYVDINNSNVRNEQT